MKAPEFIFRLVASDGYVGYGPQKRGVESTAETIADPRMTEGSSLEHIKLEAQFMALLFPGIVPDLIDRDAAIAAWLAEHPEEK